MNMFLVLNVLNISSTSSPTTSPSSINQRSLTSSTTSHPDLNTSSNTTSNTTSSSLQVVLFDRMPDGPYIDLLTRVYSPHHPVIRAEHYGNKRVSLH